MMRITENTLVRHNLRNLENNYSKMGAYLKEVSSGKKMSLPSDNPIGVEKSLSWRSSLSRLEQFNVNIENIQQELNAAENVINNIQDNLLKVKEISIKALGLGSDASANSQELGSILKNIISLANTSYEGKYLFSGFKTDSLPFAADEPITKVDYKGDSGQKIVQVGENRTVGANNVGNSQDANVLGLFVDKAAGVDIFKTIIDLQKAVSGQETTSIREQQNSLDDYSAYLSAYIQQLGIKQNDLEELKNIQKQMITDKQTLVSGVEEADATESLTNFSQQQSIYQASLAAAAKSNFSNLFDYLF